MPRYRKKRERFYNDVISNTEVLVNGNNLIISTISVKNKKIQYCIEAEVFAAFADILYRTAVENCKIDVLTACELIKKDVFKMYKTKIATVSIPYLILNALVLKNILFTDDGEEYELKGTEADFISALITMNALEKL